MESTNKKKYSLTRNNDWMSVVFNLQVFLSLIIGIRFIIYYAYISTTLFGLFIILLAILGLTAGAHRLWAHQSYKATTGLKIFLMLCQTLAIRGSIYDWVLRHRLHHKHFGTDLDPYNPKKGFFYSYFVSNNLKFSEAQLEAMKEIDMSDLKADSIVMFQKKYYWPLIVIVALLLPINAPAEYWGESLLNSLFILGWSRYGVVSHFSFLLHSATCIWDLKTNIRELYNSNAVFFINKTHWLSYHYLTPWDYQASEFGKYGTDCTSKFIRVCAALELATDLKTTTSETIRKALAMAVDENKPVAECLATFKDCSNLPVDHFLTPSKLTM